MATGLERDEGETTRLAMLAELRDQPGATAADLARALGVRHTTAAYHLVRLEKGGIIAAVRNGRRRHFFVNGQASPRDRPLLICQRLGRSGEVLARLPPEAAVPLGAVSQGLAMTKAGAYWHLCRLAALGLVVAEGPPKGRRYRRADAFPAPSPAVAPPAAVASAVAA